MKQGHFSPERPKSQKQQHSVASSLHQVLEFAHMGRGGDTQPTFRAWVSCCHREVRGEVLQQLQEYSKGLKSAR